MQVRGFATSAETSLGDVPRGRGGGDVHTIRVLRLRTSPGRVSGDVSRGESGEMLLH